MDRTIMMFVEGVPTPDSPNAYLHSSKYNCVQQPTETCLFFKLCLNADIFEPLGTSKGLDQHQQHVQFAVVRYFRRLIDSLEDMKLPSNATAKTAHLVPTSAFGLQSIGMSELAQFIEYATTLGKQYLYMCGNGLLLDFSALIKSIVLKPLTQNMVNEHGLSYFLRSIFEDPNHKEYVSDAELDSLFNVNREEVMGRLTKYEDQLNKAEQLVEDSRDFQYEMRSL